IFLPIILLVVLIDELLSDLLRWVVPQPHVLFEPVQTVCSAILVSAIVFRLVKLAGKGSDAAETARAKAEAELRLAHSDLEKRVEARTAELARANHELREEILERRTAQEALRQSEQKNGALL